MDESTPLEISSPETVPTEPVTEATEGPDPTLPQETVPESIPETVPETSEEISVESTQDSSWFQDEQTSTEATIYEDLSGSEYEETTEATEAVVIADVIESVGSDIAHASLFSGFLVSGTLVGIFLLRKVYGT